ncbi:MAG: sensor histidine kinase [Melioribacteraceae bacterium]
MSLQELLQSLLNPANPIYISLLIVGLLFGLIYVVNKYLINPSISKYQIEKENLELKSAKLMALFAQLNPDPLIRVNSAGEIVETNKVADEISPYPDIKGKKINEIFPFLEFDPDEALRENHTKVITHKLNDTYYSILLRSEPSLGITQIYFHDITALKTYEKKLIESEKKLRELSDHLHSLIEQERERLAKGLHDGIGQSLSMLRIKIVKMSEKEEVAAQKKKYIEIIETLEEAILELKNISYDLKPRMLEEMGLGFAIKFMADKVASETGIIGEVNVIGGEIRLESKLEIYVYRIAQEAITNILKYSRATYFSIQLIIKNRFIRMMISDDGSGFDIDEVSSRREPLHGMGLINIKERVESYHGEFKIESSPENGTMIVVEIPLEKELIWQN